VFGFQSGEQGGSGCRVGLQLRQAFPAGRALRDVGAGAQVAVVQIGAKLGVARTGCPLVRHCASLSSSCAIISRNLRSPRAISVPTDDGWTPMLSAISA